MIKPLLFKPTTVNISPNAIKKAYQIHGEDTAPLMLHALKKLETKAEAPTTFLDKVKAKLATKTKLILDVDTTPDAQFTVTANRQIGQYTFNGAPKTFPLATALETLKDFKKAVLESKEQALGEIKEFNRFKKTVDITPPNMLI